MPVAPAAGSAPVVRSSRRLSKVPVVIAFVLLVLGMLLSLFFLLNRHPRTQSAVEFVTRDKGDQLEGEILELQKKLPPSQSAAARAQDLYRQDLKHHEELLNQLTAERALTEQRQKDVVELLKEVKETEDRTRGAAALFLGIFGAIAAILLGQGYSQIRGWTEDADYALQRVEAVQPHVEAITLTRKSLEDHLPEHINQVQKSLALDAPNATAVAKMDELDHLTYLGASIRFQNHRSEEQAKAYLQSLLSAARGHIAKKNNPDAEIRLQEFFKVLDKYPGAADRTTTANAHSSRAFVSWRMLHEISMTPSWARQIRQAEAAELHRKAFFHIARAHESDPNWEHAYFVAALLFTYHSVPDHVTDIQKRRDLRRDGLRNAIEQYEKILELGARQSQGFAAWQNLACCLKLVAEVTGDAVDYLAFKRKLRSYPSDAELRASLLASGKQETERHFLWQAMLADSELFGEVTLDHSDYRSFWIEVLSAKVTLRNWRDDLQELKVTNPKMGKWILPA